MVYKGIRFPNNINTPNSVAKVLNQQAGKLKASELKSELLLWVVINMCVTFHECPIGSACSDVDSAI